MHAVALTLAAAVEVAVIVAAGFAGYRLGGGGLVSWLAALSLAGAVIALWGLFAAPKAPHRLNGAPLLVFKLAIFAFGVAATFWVWGPAPAILLAAAAAAYLFLALKLDIL